MKTTTGLENRADSTGTRADRRAPDGCVESFVDFKTAGSAIYTTSPESCVQTRRNSRRAPSSALMMRLAAELDAKKRRQRQNPVGGRRRLVDVNEKRGRDRDADFTAFVDTCGGRLYRTAELLTGDPHRAADLVQSSLERAYLRWGRIQADDPIAYVRRIMLNQQRDWWRRARSREWLTAQPPEAQTLGDLAAEASQRVLVLGALARLTLRERTVVVLRYYDDLSEAAIAEQTGVAIGTVKSTLSRAMGKLRALPELSPHAEHRIEAEQ